MLSQVNDFQTWNSISINYSLSKKSHLIFKESVRLSENSTFASNIFSQIFFSQKINKHFYLSLGYRFSNKSKVDDNYNKHYFYLETSINKKIKKIYLSYRLRFQDVYKSIYRTDNWMFPETFLRNKFTLSYKLQKKIKLYISNEFYFQFNNKTEFNKYRVSLGTKYKINKTQSMSIFYRHQQSSSYTLLNDYIVGIGYKIKI